MIILKGSLTKNFSPIWTEKIRTYIIDGRNELVAKEGQYRKVNGKRYALDADGSTYNYCLEVGGMGL